MIEDLQLTRADYGSANTPQLVLQALGAPLAGWLCVRVGTRPVLVAGIALQVLAISAMAGVDSLAGYLVCMGVLGFGLAGTGDVSVGSVAARWVERSRGLALGIVYSGANLGGAVFSWLASAGGDEVDWRTLLLFAGGVGALSMFPFAIFAIREPGAGEGVRPEPRSLGGANLTPAAGPDLTLAEALRTRSFWLIGAAIFAMFFCFVGLQRHFVLILESAELTHARAAALYSVGIAIGLFTKALSGAVADRISPISGVVANQLLTALAALAAAGIAGEGALVWLFVAAYGLGTAARDVVFPLALTHAFGVRSLAPIYGVQTLWLIPGGVLGPYFAGLVFDHSGSYAPALYAYTAAMVATAIGLAFVKPETGRAPQH
jgi:MFS family permease